VDSGRWQRTESIFHEVADEPAGPDRDRRVLELAEGDKSLADSVLALLAAEIHLDASVPSPDRHIGLRLGSYHIDSLVGRGGQASVYLARRADDQFEQRVAIKIMDVRISDDALVRAFRSERQILAALEHANLTRLIDGGVTPFDEPYLVMEYIDGLRIDQYCDRERLDAAARVRLFAQACAGVAYAHRNLTLHRDLKPSNILVTSNRVPKIVDFGTAALLQPERLTTVSRAPLTPSYASPEQLTGQPVGTASDQYSLALVLFELLTGTPVVPHGTSLIRAVERALTGAEAPPPHVVIAPGAANARRTTTRRLERILSGDLGTILRKALSHDASARYAGLEHFIDDLYRWLRGEAVLGRPQSLSYRSARFVSRHRVAVGTATVLLVSLIVATSVSVRQARIARRESAKAVELNKFLTTMLSSANPSWVNPNAMDAGSVTVRQVLDGTVDLLRSRTAMDPDIEAEIRRTVGRTYASLGAVEEARLHLRRAVAVSTETGDQRGVAYGESLLGTTMSMSGDYTTAETLARRAVAYYRTAGKAADPAERAEVLNDLAVAVVGQRPDDAEAIALMQEAIALGVEAESPAVAVMETNLAVTLYRTGRLDEAESAVRSSLERIDAMPKPIPERASALRTLALVLWQQGQYAEAEPFAREAVEFALQVRPATHYTHPNNKAWWGRTLASLGRGEQARAVSRDAYEAYTKIRPHGHPELAIPLIGLGVAHRLLGDLPESERKLREAEAIIRKLPAQRDRIADMAGELGLTLRAMGKTDDAQRLLRESHDILQQAYGNTHPLTRQAKARIGR
jgi:eukaryotic-like serine/threonine-protein kinase